MDNQIPYIIFGKTHLGMLMLKFAQIFCLFIFFWRMDNKLLFIDKLYGQLYGQLNVDITINIIIIFNLDMSILFVFNFYMWQNVLF